MSLPFSPMGKRKKDKDKEGGEKDKDEESSGRKIRGKSLRAVAAPINLMRNLFESPLEFEVRFDNDESLPTRDLFEHIAKCYSDLKQVKGEATITAETTPVRVRQVDQPLCGDLIIKPKQKQKSFHTGITLEFVGQVVLDGKVIVPLANSLLTLQAGGNFSETLTLPFDFPHVEAHYDSYIGERVLVRYYLQTTLTKPGGQVLSHTFPLWFEHPPPDAIPSSFGSPVSECFGKSGLIMVKFSVTKTGYYLSDAIEGELRMLYLNDFAIDRVELQILRVEAVDGEEVSCHNVWQFELMEGSTRPGTVLPIRIPLRAAAALLTPTMKNLHKRVSIRYCLCLAIFEEGGEERAFYRKQEVYFFR